MPRDVSDRDRDVSIAYEVAGRGDPLVLVHGLSGSSRWWRRNVPALAERFRVYAIDLIRFGRNRSRDRFVLRDASRHLARWMEASGIARAHVVGHSMGGFIAADLALSAPERVERLVLAAPAVFPRILDSDAPPGRDATPRLFARHAWGLARAALHASPTFIPVLARDAWRCGPGTLLRAARELLESDLGPRLAGIRAPTLVVWGEHDHFVPLAAGRRVTETVKGARLVVLAGAGHVPMWEAADAFNGVVLDFLSQVPEEAAPEAGVRPRELA